MDVTPFFGCPNCHSALEHTAPNQLTCPGDGFCFMLREGIWHFLMPERARYYEKFIREYEAVRRAEGRLSADPAYYRALPYRDLNRDRQTDWRIRAASFLALLKNGFVPNELPGAPLSILDLGSGNGWLSNQLALRGHKLFAVDLTTNAFDGLACARYYESEFTSTQAEFDHLPFQSNIIDLVVFNASLHYSINIRNTLAESLRVLSDMGRLVILDSPVYQDAQSGKYMVQEREQIFTARFGFPSNSLPSENFITYRYLQELEKDLSITWQIITPFYGFRWLIKPLIAKIRATREPAKFHLIIGRKTTHLQNGAVHL